MSIDELLEAHRRFHSKVGCPNDGCYVCEAEEAYEAAKTVQPDESPNTAGDGVNSIPSIRHDADGVGSPSEQLKNLQSWYPSKWDIEKALKESRGYNPKEMSLHGIRTLRILADVELARQSSVPMRESVEEENRVLREALFPRPEIKDCSPLILYFSTKDERDEFVALVAEAKPNMRSYKV